MRAFGLVKYVKLLYYSNKYYLLNNRLSHAVPCADVKSDGFSGQPIFANDRAGPGTIKDGLVK